MKIIEMKLKESLIEAVKEIQINESDVVWVEVPETTSQSEFQKIQDIVSESFSMNRVIVVPKGCKLRFDNPDKKESKCRDANRFDEPMESQQEYKGGRY